MAGQFGSSAAELEWQTFLPNGMQTVSCFGAPVQDGLLTMCPTICDITPKIGCLVPKWQKIPLELNLF